MTNEHWRYFLALEQDVERTTRFVEPHLSNYKTFSIEFARLIISTCSEVDVVAKVLCDAIAPSAKPSTETGQLHAKNRKEASAALKHYYERLRIPLAKLEPSNRHRATDYAFARPGIDDERGIAWEVAKDVVISRSRLSDEFLDFLEKLQNGTLKN